MDKRKIWIVTELFHPDETATAFIFTRIANYLSNDYKVCVICGPEVYDHNKVNYKDSYPVSKDITLYRTKPLSLDKNSLIQRSLKVIILSLRMSLMVVKKVSKGEIVLLATNPAPLLLMMGLIKKWKKFQMHILVHDVFPENTIPAHIFGSNKSIIYRLLKSIYDRAYSKADHLIAIGRDMKVVLGNKSRKFNSNLPISVVPNWSNSTILKPGLPFELTEKAKEVSGKIIFQFAGNIGRVQGLDIVIDSFVSSANSKIQLIIRGTGALYSSIENLISSNNWKNIKLMGSYAREEENTLLSKCNISVVSLSPGMYGLGVPSKTYNLLALGKPILFIGDPDSEISLLVKEYDIGWSIDINNKSDIVDFFRNIKPEDESDFQKKGQRARLLAENQYEEKKILALLQKQMETHFNQ